MILLGDSALFIVNFNSKKKKFRYKIFQYKQTGLLWKAIPELYANGMKSSIYIICLVWSLWVFATNATSGKKYRCLIEISLIGKYQTDFCIPWLPAKKGKDILLGMYLSTAPAFDKKQEKTRPRFLICICSRRQRRHASWSRTDLE